MTLQQALLTALAQGPGMRIDAQMLLLHVLAAPATTAPGLITTTPTPWPRRGG